MSEHHPYRTGYSVLPGLQRIAEDQVFVVETAHFERCLREKQQAVQTQMYRVRHQLSDACERAAVDWISNHYPVPLKPVETLDDLVRQMQEDVVIHCLSDQRDWMAYGHVCLPSGWLPEEKIGRTFVEIHQPVAGMDLSNSRKLVETIVYHGPFERFVWSVVFEDELNFHPQRSRKKFDPNAPSLYVKVERQVTIGMPEQGGALFLLNQYLIPEERIDKPALSAALQSMTPEQRAYKGLQDDCENIIQWLEVISKPLPQDF